MAPKGEIDIETIERAIEKAKDEIEDFDGEDYIGNRGVFILCQYLKGIDMPDAITFTNLKPYVRRWYELSGSLLVDECGAPLTFTEAWAQFVEVWPKIKYPKSAYLEQAKERAGKRTEPLAELAEFDEAHQYLGAVCYELQQITGGEPFWLSTYDAGRILGKSQRVGHRALQMFMAEGILERTKIGHTNIASEYRYIGKTNSFGCKRKITPSEFEGRKQKSIKALLGTKNQRK